MTSSIKELNTPFFKFLFNELHSHPTKLSEVHKVVDSIFSFNLENIRNFFEILTKAQQHFEKLDQLARQEVTNDPSFAKEIPLAKEPGELAKRYYIHVLMKVGSDISQSNSQQVENYNQLTLYSMNNMLAWQQTPDLENVFNQVLESELHTLESANENINLLSQKIENSLSCIKYLSKQYHQLEL